MNRRRHDDSWSSMGMMDREEPLNAAPELTLAPRSSKSLYRNDDVSVSSTATPRTRRLALFVARFDKMLKSPAPRQGPARREKFAKLASIESLDLASSAPPMSAEAGAYSRRSLEVNEDPNAYFETMKKRAHERRSQSDSHAILNATPRKGGSLYSYLSSGDSDDMGKLRARQRRSRMCHDTDAEVEEHQTVSGSVAAFSTSEDYTVASRAMTDGGIAIAPRRKKKKKKKRSSSKCPKHYYAQLCFEKGEAGVEYARIPNDIADPESSVSPLFAISLPRDEGKNAYRLPVDLSVLQHDYSIPLLGIDM